jgi:YggT family protein
MIILANVMGALAKVLNSLIGMVMLALILQALMSWLNPNPHSPFYRVLAAISDPVLRPLRARIPPIGGIDLTPIIVILFLMFVQDAVVRSLDDYSSRLRAEALMPSEVL